MSKNWKPEEIAKLTALRLEGENWSNVGEALGVSANCARKAFYRYTRDDAKPQKSKLAPKILILDIETAPLEVYTWGLFDQNIGLEMVKQHTTVLSWSAKWHGDDKVMYRDLRNADDVRDDKELVSIIRELLDEADIIITQNGKKFDAKKLNARFVKHGLKPPSSYKHIDTLQIAKSKFGFDSNKLAHMTAELCTKHKKLSHGKFPGFQLWKECLAGNQEAWKEMQEYNQVDVLSLEELYFDHFAAWDNTVNFAVYSDEFKFRCNCGNDELVHKGYHITKRAKYKRFICTDCGKEHRDSENLFSAEKRKELKV
jgi:uncharacterized protein YprB with RNaseH-like and TPR domain